MNAILRRYSDYARDFDAVLVVGLLEGDPVLPGSLDRAGRAAARGCAPARPRSPARPLSICYTNRDPCVMRTVIPVLHCPHAQILSRITGAAGPGLAPSSISGVLSGARTLDRDPVGDRPHPR